MKSLAPLCLLLGLTACVTQPPSTTSNNTPPLTTSAASNPTPNTPINNRLTSNTRPNEWANAAVNVPHITCPERLSAGAPAPTRPWPEYRQNLHELYLCQWQAQQSKAAEKTLQNLLTQHLKHQTPFTLQLLFRPGSTRYASDPRVSAVYPTWLRQIAYTAQQQHACIAIQGYQGPSKLEQSTPDLANKRAKQLQRQLSQYAPNLEQKSVQIQTPSQAPAFIGSATDNWRDALDRRVSIQLHPC